MNVYVEYLLGFIILLGFLTYIGVIAWACFITLKGDEPLVLPEIVAGLITSISGILSINLGSVLGFVISLKSLTYYENSIQNPFIFFISPSVTNLQISACYIYILCLTSATIIWGLKGFKTNKAVPILSELTKSFIGIIIGTLAVVLAKPN